MGPYIQDQNGSSDFHALEQFSPSVTTTTPTAYRTGWLAAGPKQNGSSDFHALEYFFPSVTTTTPTAHSTGWLAAGPKKGGGGWNQRARRSINKRALLTRSMPIRVYLCVVCSSDEAVLPVDILAVRQHGEPRFPSRSRLNKHQPDRVIILFTFQLNSNYTKLSIACFTVNGRPSGQAISNRAHR